MTSQQHLPGDANQTTQWAVTTFIKGECSGWKWFEILWLIGCPCAVLLLSLTKGDTTLSITASITGVIYTLLAGKGKVSCYVFGFVNSFLYGYASFNAKLFGDAMLNWGYYMPMMLIGLFLWSKNRNKQATVHKTKLSLIGRCITIVFSIIGIFSYGLVLWELGGSQPFIDSTTTILSVGATILTIKRCIEQWLLWTIVNSVSIFMWWRVYLAAGNSLALLAMWTIFLVIGIVFFFQWLKEASNEKSPEAYKHRFH